MIIDVLLRKPLYWLIPWILQSTGYFFVLKKMDLNSKWCFIPFLAEGRFSSVMFKRMRTFYRPFIIALVFIAGAYYLGPSESMGIAYLFVAWFVYWTFLIRLYHIMSKRFGHGIPFSVGLALFPTLFLLILGLGKSKYLGPPTFKPDRPMSRGAKALHGFIVGVITIAEIAVLVFGVGSMTIRALPPRVMVNSTNASIYDKTKNIEASMECVTREDTLGDDAADLAGLTPSREYFAPDHSGDKSVVVMEYIIGSNLEHSAGLASANISMMKDATEKGDALTFVVEAGGSKRWFTNGIADESYGRYSIKGGKLTKELDLENETMSDASKISDFIKWTKENYPADRYMLVLWDHGGGLALGYGQDYLNEGEGDYGTIPVSDLAAALKDAGLKFDLIGFDACLMQDIEVARALEPYADYYLASEELEGGYGWYYTSGFGKLAEDPGISTEEFGKDMVSAYDQFNTILNDGEPSTGSTLSLVDLTLMKPAYKRLDGLFEKAADAVESDPDAFADISLAAANTYSFEDGLQLDIPDYMDKLSDADIHDSIISEKERNDIKDAALAAVVCRNSDSAEGINGLAFAFPYGQMDMVEYTDSECSKLSLKNQRSFSEDVFSIIASQKKKEHEAKLKELENDKHSKLKTLIEKLSYYDYTGEDWYKEGFEDYVTASALVDIPLKAIEGSDEFEIDLPAKTWDIITDCRTVVYQKDGDRLRYIGADHIGGEDANGHPTLAADDIWVHIGGKLVCYESQPVARETEEGYVYTGKVKALLNGEDEIILDIEWDAVSEENDETEGHVTGYEFADDDSAFLSKGTYRLNSGDTLEFLFDYYDEEGNKTTTEAYGGSLIVNTQNRLKVTEEPMEPGDIEYMGLLTDVYQREIMTEVVEATIE